MGIQTPYKIWLVLLTVNLNFNKTIQVRASMLSRWLVPCHGSQPSDHEIYGSHDDTESELTVIQALWIQTHIVKELTEQIRDSFVNERIQSDHLLEILNNNTSIPHLIMPRNMSQRAQLPDVYTEHYRVIAISAVYLTQLRDDEVNERIQSDHLLEILNNNTSIPHLIMPRNMSQRAQDWTSRDFQLVRYGR
ncbi:hypothetical protein ACF0H5_008671 [Mactra antiquata]